MSTVALTGDQNIDGVLWGVKWDLPSLTYGFATSTNQYGGYGIGSIGGFEAFNTAQRNAATDTIDQLKDIIRLNVTFVSDASQANLRYAEASVVFQDGSSPGTISTAIGTPPDDTLFPAFGHGDMFYNRTDYNNPVKGNFAYATVIHETGHALGLKHGHVTQQYPGSSVIIPALSTSRDSMEYSIMTYRSNTGGPTDFYRNETFGYAQSWMMQDIAALQYLYGADFTSNAGNTVYSWSSTTGEMFIDGVGQGKPGANRVFLTIWDGNGVDSYDMSNYTTGVSINLAPGSFSITAQNQRAILNTETNVKARGNVFNALLFEDDLRSLIENALGGSGDDKLTGNIGKNVLRGNNGDDNINGLDGNDSLIGGNDNDTLSGGDGNDTLNGGANDDTQTGGGGADRMIGGIGRDTQTGGAGNDRFIYANRNEAGDIIRDFRSAAAGNNDRFEFDGAAFGALPDGTLAANRFQSSNAATAQTAAVRFMFEQDTGILRFDADGSGSGAAIIIATLQASAIMVLGDILIV